MGAPWARYFRMKIPESKYRLDPGLRLLHTKNVCKNFLLSRLKKNRRLTTALNLARVGS